MAVGGDYCEVKNQLSSAIITYSNLRGYLRPFPSSENAAMRGTTMMAMRMAHAITLQKKSMIAPSALQKPRINMMTTRAHNVPRTIT